MSKNPIYEIVQELIGLFLGSLVGVLGGTTFLRPDFPFFVLFPWWSYILAIIIISEILFLRDDEKPIKKDNVFVFTFFVKGWFLILGSFIVVVLQGIANVIWLLFSFSEPILVWFGMVLPIIGIGGLIMAFISYIWLNSLKFKKKSWEE